MHNFTRCIECTFGFSIIYLQQIFKYFTQHFRVDSYLTFHRLIFAHGKIISVENIQNTICFTTFGWRIGENFIRNIEIIMLPIISVNRLKQATGQEGNSAM